MSIAQSHDQFTDSSLATRELVLISNSEQLDVCSPRGELGSVSCVDNVWIEYEAPHKRWALPAAAALAIANKDV